MRSQSVTHPLRNSRLFLLFNHIVRRRCLFLFRRRLPFTEPPILYFRDQCTKQLGLAGSLCQPLFPQSLAREARK